jgi:hypothetical protein
MVTSMTFTVACAVRGINRAVLSGAKKLLPIRAGKGRREGAENGVLLDASVECRGQRAASRGAAQGTVELGRLA